MQETSKRYVCWFSCGAASAVATKIALAKYDNVIIAYCRVREEHSDNMRFLKDCEKWFGQEIIILEHEHYKGSIYNVFEKQYMNTPSGSPCTRILKKAVREKFQQPNDVHVFGYTKEEKKRADKFIDANSQIETAWTLIDADLSKEEVLAMVERAGIELPVMYKLGYEHNNCVGCVKGGMGYWNKIRVDFPDEFKRMADFEKRKGYTVLKERKDGSPIFLHDLDPNRGRMTDEPKIECGIFCEIAEEKYSDKFKRKQNELLIQMETPKMITEKAKTPKSKNDNWSTPFEVFDQLDFEFGFEWDVCAEHSTAQTDLYWTIDDDALLKDWVHDTGNAAWLWCNPPYSKIMPWVDKAIEAQARGVGVVMLVMCDPSVRWFSKALAYCSEVRFITGGRLGFVNNGVTQKGNNKGSAIFVFDPKRIGVCQTKYVERSSFGL